MRFEYLGFDPDFVDYEKAWEHQREVHAKVVASVLPDTILLLEHEYVFTAGKRTEPHERPWNGAKVVDVDRGGKITWHGPGQLVGYPIVHLPTPVDVVAHVRDRGPERKLGAIGVRVSQNVTMHGFALNADPDLSWAEIIVPCGIADAGVSSLSREAGRRVSVAELLPYAERHLTDVLTAAPAVAG